MSIITFDHYVARVLLIFPGFPGILGHPGVFQAFVASKVIFGTNYINDF